MCRDSTIGAGSCNNTGRDQQMRRKQRRRSCDLLKARPATARFVLSFSLSTVLCLSLLCQRTAAFPKETTLGWGKLSRLSSSDHHQQQQQQSSCLLRLQRLQQDVASSRGLLQMARHSNIDPNQEGGRNGGDDSSENNGKRRFGKKDSRRQQPRYSGGRGFGPSSGWANSTTAVMEVASIRRSTKSSRSASPLPSEKEQELTKRMTQLEHLVAKQTVEIRRLQDECRDLKEISSAFAHVLEMMRAAGLDTTDRLPEDVSLADKAEERAQEKIDNALLDEANAQSSGSGDVNMEGGDDQMMYEYFDDTEIFGEAPSSVTDAADAAGAAILAGLLGGKQRMLVDVRDSELSGDPETLVQFIELTILPVAAGLEGMESKKNRVKIVFPTVSQLLEYRRTMALAAPEVVALSTLGFDPVEERDNIVVIVAPSPDSEEGLKAMNELLEPPPGSEAFQIQQPVVVLNHHMVPLSGPAADYDVMYHLRLLSVQYMSGERADDVFSQFEDPLTSNEEFEDGAKTNMTVDADEELLEAAMKHAHEVGVNRGLTRAMVIRSYPK